MDDKEDMQRAFKVASIVGVAIVISLLLNLILVEAIRALMKPFQGMVILSEVTVIRYVFYGLAVLEVIAVRVFQGLLLKRTPGDSARTTIHKLSRTAIATVCLSEVPALLGLVLFILGGLNKDFYALLAVSLVLVFMYFPRLRNWEEWLERNS